MRELERLLGRASGYREVEISVSKFNLGSVRGKFPRAHAFIGRGSPPETAYRKTLMKNTRSRKLPPVRHSRNLASL